MWYKLTNPQETNIALNIIISTGNDIQIVTNYHIWRHLVKPLRQQLFYTVRCFSSLYVLLIPPTVSTAHKSYHLTGIAVAISTTADWSVIYISTQFFPSLLASIGTFGSLYMFSLINLTSALFVIFFLPETKVNTSLSYETDIIVLLLLRASHLNKWRKYLLNHGLRGWGSLAAAGKHTIFESCGFSYV